MEIKALRLQDFRNYVAAEAELDPGLNLVVGRNGQGKTSLLEAVYCLSALGSHRTARVSSLVRHGQERAFVWADGISGRTGVAMEAQIEQSGGIKVWLNRQRIGSTGTARSMVAVLFGPEDLELIKGGPEHRRRFLDQASARTRPVTVADRYEFERALRQRNGVLKAGKRNRRALDQLEAWNEQVARTGTAVIMNRWDLLEALVPAMQRRHRELAQSQTPTAVYRASWDREGTSRGREAVADCLARALQESQSLDLETASTSVGPHRDDLMIELGGAAARSYASQGEQRSLALSMRLAEKDVAAAAHGEEPILLLDDVFSELDRQRRERLGELVAASGQTIATATAAESLPLEAGRTLLAVAGTVRGVG